MRTGESWNASAPTALVILTLTARGRTTHTNGFTAATAAASKGSPVTDCNCRYRYLNGENERIWLATANSELRSALLKAEQEIEQLTAELVKARLDHLTTIGELVEAIKENNEHE